MGVMAVITTNMLLFFGTVIGIFVTISLIQTFVIEGETENPELPQQSGLIQQSELLQPDMPQPDMPQSEVTEQPEEDWETGAKPQMEVAWGEATEDALREEVAEETATGRRKRKSVKKKKQKKNEKKNQKGKQKRNRKSGSFSKASEEADAYAEEMDELLAEIESSLEVVQGKETAEAYAFDKEEEAQEDEKPQQASEKVMATYNKKKIKKVMHKYRVKRDHRMIMIDHSEQLQIYQTPAYIWLMNKELHFLLIEKEPRHISIPEYQFREVNYLKKQLVNEDMDYGAFKGTNMLSELFRPYLPDYIHSTVVDDLSAYKNLYGLGNEIFVTNRSAAALFDLLPVEFRVDDKVTLSTKVNVYFKEAYKANILLRDNVIDANGYADKISNVLNNLAHSTVSYAEFKETLNLMIKNKLITQEFAMYYMDVRNKLS